MPLPRGRQQLESSGGLNLAKGPGEVIQLFGGKDKDDLSLYGWLISRITLCLQCSAKNIMLRYQKGYPLLMR